jgi:hypothetical protein
MKKLIGVACAAFALVGCDNAGTGGSDIDTDYDTTISGSSATNAPYTGGVTNYNYNVAPTNEMNNQGGTTDLDTGGTNTGTGSSTNVSPDTVTDQP